jgi:5-methyltetrahydrofolate--homocysteine methyltransferase
VAEWTHRRSKQELGVPSGKRYSWGYGACPDLDDHATVFKLLPAKEALGMDLTEAFQLLPEQSTAAVIIHHPEAKYYAVRGSAADASSLPEAAVA